MKYNQTKAFFLNIFIMFFVGCYSQKAIGLKQGNYDNQVEITTKGKYLYAVLSTEGLVVCELFMWGDLDSDEGKITIYEPISESTSKGSLIKTKDGIKIKADEFLMPCERDVNLINGWGFPFNENSKWENLPFDIVKSKTAFLFIEPNQITKKKAYLLKNDIVYVLEEKDSWVKVKYSKNFKKFYWIKKEDLYGVPR
jgi:hypothetical protein